MNGCSPQGRVWLSCDTRYQRTGEPVDPRWMGSPPIGHGGVCGARPMTAELIRR
ncbi:MAG: hypothetical protein HYV27_01000 [Candidatus Hydrogenedentes bacterium]|nr:hypothetical protein [Candidatus Hydrogenedentota bacterium]